MTAGELAGLIGKMGEIQIDRLSFPVMVIDARFVWNRIDVLIQPIGGSGEQWVSKDRVKIKIG